MALYTTYAVLKLTVKHAVTEHGGVVLRHGLSQPGNVGRKPLQLKAVLMEHSAVLIQRGPDLLLPDRQVVQYGEHLPHIGPVAARTHASLTLD